FAPTRLLAIAEGRAHRQRQERRRLGAGEAKEQRAYHARERDVDRCRIARQTDERCARASARGGDDAHRDPPSGLDGDAPKYQPPDGLDRVPHMVGLAGGNAARGDDEVMLRRGRGNRTREPLRIVGQDAEIGRRGAEALDEPREQIAIGVEQRGTRSRRSRLDDLVAGREQGDAHAAEYVERGQADGGGGSGGLGGEPGGSTSVRARAPSPAGRRLGPPLSPAGTITAFPSRRTSSCMKTVSAPPGMGAPVKMRTAAPAASTRAAARPAVTLSTTSSRVSALASRSAWRTA